MVKSRFVWTCAAFAPWFLGACALVSFTASAGQESTIGGSVSAPTRRLVMAPAELVPMRAAMAGAAFNMPMPRGDALMRQARLVIGEPADLGGAVDEVEPRVSLKRRAGPFPEIDRSRKGDPLVGLRPTFDAKWRTPERFGLARSANLIFAPDPQSLVGVFSPSETAPAAADRFEAFEEFGGDEDAPTTGAARGPSSPAPAEPARALIHYGAQGATPRVPRAVALGSTTPVDPRGAPIEIAAAPVSAKAGRGERAVERPDYAALISTNRAAQEQRCLAEAVYFEARSEPEAGQAAVAQVVLNRVRSGLYPASVCGVVYQNRHRHLACQFTFACEGKPLRITEPEAWRTAQRLAAEVTSGRTYNAEVGGSTHYHAGYVRPRWAKRLVRMDRIGQHIFYRLRPGQT